MFQQAQEISHRRFSLSPDLSPVYGREEENWRCVLLARLRERGRGEGKNVSTGARNILSQVFPLSRLRERGGELALRTPRPQAGEAGDAVEAALMFHNPLARLRERGRGEGNARLHVS
jgi:hypothetical protein